MSLTYPNAESVKLAILEELQNILSHDSSVRTSAEGRMKHLEFTEGYAIHLAELIMNQSFDLSLRQLACIMLTRYIEEYWAVFEGSGPCFVTDQTKKAIRNILPNGLYDTNSKIRSAVAHTISTIASTDWPTIWTELFDIIIKCLGGNENSIHGAMQILKDFSYDDKQIKELGPIVISEVYRIFETEKSYSIKTRTYAIKILKQLFRSININITEKQEQTAMMNSVLTNFMGKLIQELSMNSDSSNFMLKTEIIKIFAFLVLEMPKYVHPFMNQILPPIWQLLTQIADVYVKVIVNQSQPNPFPSADDEEDDDMTNFNTMLIQIFEFIQCIIDSGKFKSIVKNVLTDLVYIVIVYIQVSEEQIELWEDDPEIFVEDEGEIGVELTIRLSGQDVLNALHEEFGPKMLTPLSEALGRHMNVAEAEKSAGNPKWWKINEACMVAVHTFEELILNTENQFDLLNYLTFVRNLLNYQESAYLVGRSLWTLSSYSQSSLFNAQMLEEILEVTLNSLSPDKPIILKISAIRAINGFVNSQDKTNDEKRIIIYSKLEGFVDGILCLVPGCKSSVLGLVLQALNTIIMFDQNFAASIHSKVIPLTIAIFLKFSEDPYILEMVQDILKTLSQNPLCLHPLQIKIIPTLVSILNLQGDPVNAAKQDIALDVLTTIVKHSQAPLSENLIENAFPAAIHCVLRSDDHSVMLSGGECLRAYIFVAPEQVCAYKNGEGLNYIMQLTTMLLNPMNNEMTAGQIGRLVITIISKMGNLLGENIDLLLKAVISKMQLVECLKVIMSLVVIFAHLFLTQMDAVLNFLTTVPGPTGEPALQFLFTNWLSKQTMFFGSYERKVTTMALCKLFEYGITTQDNRLTAITVKEQVITNNATSKMKTRSASAPEWVNIPALVKIFKLLINELGHIKESKRNDSESEGWTDDENEEGSQTKSPTKERFVSDLNFVDDEDENSEDDQLITELLKDPLFQTSLEETLTKFLQNFSSNEHFSTFASHLNVNEKAILKGIQVEVQ